jgi:hypothetical protein
MKAMILFVALFIGMSVNYNAMAQGKTKAKKTTTATETKSGTVYVCDSKTAKSYHSKKECGMLKKCKGTVKEMSKADAEAKGYTACKSCDKMPKAK